MRTATAFAFAALLGLTTPPAGAAGPTARASGILAVQTSPHDWAPTIDKLVKNERVELDFCTRQSRWCHVIQLDGGPSGWVDGTYLVGSPAKALVTPFEFSFNPLWPSQGLHPRKK